MPPMGQLARTFTIALLGLLPAGVARGEDPTAAMMRDRRIMSVVASALWCHWQREIREYRPKYQTMLAAAHRRGYHVDSDAFEEARMSYEGAYQSAMFVKRRCEIAHIRRVGCAGEVARLADCIDDNDGDGCDSERMRSLLLVSKHSSWDDPSSWRETP